MPGESTTPDLVELTRRLVGAMHRGDHDAATSVFAPTAVLDTSVGRFEGHTELRRFFEEWGGGFETLEAEPEQIDDLGNGVTFVIVAQRGRSRR